MVIRLGLFILALLAATAGSAATSVVTSAADTAGSTCGSTCTLRQAITAANATAAADTINFAITVPIRGEILISPASPLPTITQPLTINGYSQSGTRTNNDPNISNAVLRVRLDGANAGSSARGLAICASGVVIRGLSITRFAQSATVVGRDANDNACSANAVIEGNFIGLTSSGLTMLGNGGSIVARGTTTIGGANPAQRNVIADLFSAIVLGAGSAGSQVDGNLLGTDKLGNADFGGTEAIAMVDDDNSAIGTAAPNTIRHFSKGITLISNVRGVDLANNRISDSGNLGIDLNNNGVTANDVNDVDTGANDLQNFPLITAAQRVPAGVALSGTLDVGHPGTVAYKLTAYASSVCHPSGHGEGERILGQTSRNFSSSVETFSYTQTTTDPLPPGTQITMTATRAGVGTSEFSACFALDPAPLVVNTTSDTADGVCNAAHCSLRDAIVASNAATGNGFQRIHFAIPPLAGSSEIVIAPTSQLPSITRTVTIDGYTQPGTSANSDAAASNAVLRIRLDGNNVASSGLASCVSSTLRGLSITRFAAGFSDFSCAARSGTIELVGNFIGLATNGLTVLGNDQGVSGSTGAWRIGGESPDDRNVIAGGATNILLGAATAGSEVIGNLIGVDRSGVTSPALSAAAIAVNGATGVTIGTPNAPNAIAHRDFAVRVLNQGAQVVANANRFLGGDGLALTFDVFASTVTPNDPGDGDSGPNGRMNFPVLTLAERTDSGLRVGGNLDVPPGVTTVAVYASASCHGSGHGPGEQLLGLFAPASSAFDQGLITDVDLVAFPHITATATGAQGTSEMSACLAATDPPPGIAVDTASDSTTLNGGCDVTGDGNTCTLREAITLANAQPGADNIRFAIPGDGPHEIAPATLLPVITGGLLIDGYTQIGALPNAAAQGSDAVLKIELRAASTTHVLRTCSADLVDLRGLAISGGSSATIATQINDSANCSAVGSLRVRGSWLGFDSTGIGASGSTGIAANNTLLIFGGPALADRNVVGGYNGPGLRLAGAGADSSVVSNSILGFSPDLVPNFSVGRGVDLINVAGVTVGGDGGLANAIRFREEAIVVAGVDADFNRLFGNSFVDADSLAAGDTAIDLSDGSAANGINPNDVNDVDTGANEGQNTPVLTDGTATASSTTINGVLDVPTGIAVPLSYRLAFYRSPDCSDNGGVTGGRRGETYLGSFTQPFTSNAENFSVTLNAPPAAGFITATATSPGGSTSELSNCLVAPRPNDVFADGFE